ncbi:MAG: GAF domain-containing SpoIIE family protein phosphatase [Bacteroidota bacterium]
MKPKIVKGIIIATAVTTWLIVVLFHVLQFGALTIFEQADDGTYPTLPGYRIAFALFLLCNAIFVGRSFDKIEKLDVITLLWKLFMIGMGGITLILLTIILNNTTQSYTLARYLGPIFFSIGLYAFLIFFLSAVFIFRRFVLYQRTKRRVRGWTAYLGLTGFALLLGVFPLAPSFGMLYYVFVAVYVILILLLAANVRWIAYLNFNQKLRALGLFSLIVVVGITYLIATFRFPLELDIPIDVLPGYLFLRIITIFPFIYSVFAILVLFFNLPTSSIFELNSLEIASYSKINQAIQSNLDFTEIMNSLLDASVLAGNARAGWLEMISESTGQSELFIRKRIGQKEIKEIKQDQSITEKVLKDQKYYLVKNMRKHKVFRNNSSRYKCMLVVPIMSSSQTYGAIYIVNELPNSFEDVTIQSITNFAEQAGIALENAKLVKRSIEMERYQEQLKIAKDVQQQLLPHNLPTTRDISFNAKNDNASEVGGDYFDVIECKPGRFKVAIGDVSGKGTTAAFYMAEIKGIFHALARTNMTPTEFMNTSNQALVACMQKGFFVTLTYLDIDTQKKEIQLIRAGHCPAFYYNSQEDRICMMREGTLGLGIVKGSIFKSYNQEPQTIQYNSGDMLLLYTDGIIEARNEEGEEFGYQRLKNIFTAHRNMESEQLTTSIVDGVKDFTHSDLEDDYTVLAIKFI